MPSGIQIPTFFTPLHSKIFLSSIVVSRYVNPLEKAEESWGMDSLPLLLSHCQVSLPTSMYHTLYQSCMLEMPSAPFEECFRDRERAGMGERGTKRRGNMCRFPFPMMLLVSPVIECLYCGVILYMNLPVANCNTCPSP